MCYDNLEFGKEVVERVHRSAAFFIVFCPRTFALGVDVFH